MKDLDKYTSSLFVLSFLTKFLLGVIYLFSPAGSLLNPLQSSFYPHHSNKTILVQSPVTFRLPKPVVDVDSSFFYQQLLILLLEVLSPIVNQNTTFPFYPCYHVHFYFIPRLIWGFLISALSASQMLLLLSGILIPDFPMANPLLHFLLCLFQITSVVRLFRTILLKIGAIFLFFLFTLLFSSFNHVCTQHYFMSLFLQLSVCQQSVDSMGTGTLSFSLLFPQ